MKRTTKIFSLFLSLILLLSCFPLSVNAALSDMTWFEYKNKYQGFINDSRWCDSIAWNYSQRPKLSSWSSQGCCAYAADFTKYMFDASSQKSGEVFSDPSEIRAGDVIYMYNSDKDQHWIVVLERNGNMLYTAEGNRSSKVCISSSRYSVSENKLVNGKNTFKGYHYLKEEVANSPYATLGTDFYAAIYQTEPWAPVCNNSGVAEPIKDITDARSLWKFIHNPDDSYTIINAVDSSCLGVSEFPDGKAYIKCAEAIQDDSQRWFIEKNDIAYSLISAKYPDCSLSYVEDAVLGGVKLELCPKSDSVAQRFSICSFVYDDILNKSVLKVTPGNDNMNTAFSWTASGMASGYRLNIYKDGNLYLSREIKPAENITLSDQVLLQTGSYTANIESFNSFKTVTGDTVSFIVGCPHKNIVVTNKAVAPTCTGSGLTQGVKCADCKEVIKVQETIPKNGHSYKSKITKATLNKNGKIVQTCKVCAKKKTKSVIYSPASITLSREKYKYNGKSKKPAVTVTDSRGNVIDSSNYTVVYENNKKVGTATVMLKFKGKYYSGTMTKTFKIVPKGTAFTSLKAISKGFKVGWQKNAKQTTGYEIKYSTSKKFAKKASTTVKIFDINTLKREFSNLKGGKRYYVKIRTYKIVDGVKYNSAWSEVQSIKTKK